MQQAPNPSLPQNIPGQQAQPQYAQQYSGPGTAFPQQPQVQQQPQQPQYPSNPQYGQPIGQTAQSQPIYGQPQQQARTVLSDTTILDGDDMPVELRGRTFGQMKQIYNALANDWIQRNPQQQPNAPAAMQQQAQHQQAQPDQAEDFWTDPAQFVRRAVSEAVAPVTQQALGAQIAQARQIATTGVPDFPQLEAEVVSLMSGLDEGTRANPQSWVNAIDLARGRLIRSGQYQSNGNGQPTPGRPVPSQYGQPPSPNGGPGYAVPATQVPLYGFFTESPTPPAPNGQTGVPSQEDAFYAQKFGMDPQTFMAWKAAQVRRG